MSRPFRLEPVLHLRRQLVDDARLELAALELEQAVVEARLSDLRGQCTYWLRDLDRFQRDDIDVAEVQRRLAQIDRLHQRVEEQRSLASRLQAQITAKREELAERSKQHKVLEQLKARHDSQAAADARRAETRLHDELAAVRFDRDRRQR